MSKEKVVQSRLRRAGVIELAPGEAGTLAGESTLVLRGGYRSTLEIFNPHGQQIGTAKRSRGRYSGDGYQYRYELLGLRPRFILTDISKGRFVSIPEHFTVEEVDGAHIASVIEEQRS